MSYVVPSVLVYQQLTSSGGVANVTPDLDAVIIGPCYNVLSYDNSTAATLAATAGLTDSGAAYQIADNTIANVVNLPGQKLGQVVTESSISVYLNDCVVQTASTRFTLTSGSNVLTVLAATASGTTTAASKTLTITGASASADAAKFAVGDPISVAGAGAAGATLTTKITAISGTTFTMADAATTAVTGQAVTKLAVSNINSVSATRHASKGDKVYINYGSGVFTSTILSSPEASDTITSLTLADIVPAAAAGAQLVSIRKTFSNQVLPASYNGSTNLVTTAASTLGKITINPLPAVVYGTVITGSVYIAYKALRTDLSSNIQEINNPDELAGYLGAPTDSNPLSLGVQLALANTVGRILAIAVPSEDLQGYLSGLALAEGRRIYAISVLTQDTAVITAVQQHVQQMSTPEMANWRVAVVNSAIPTTQNIGPYSATNVNANGGLNTVTNVNGAYVLTVSNATFLSDGVSTGDIVNVTAATGITAPTTIKVKAVLNNQQVQLDTTSTATAVSYYVSRNLTKSQQADYVVGMCSTLASNRVMYIPQSAGVSVNGVVKNLPGYYLCCAVVGLISGLPVQQSLTNIGLAGVSSAGLSNFYFTRAQLGSMAAAGACLIVQEAQGSIPYVRHSLTTDMTTLYFREIQQVKNWDYLSYFFHDILKGFIGRYNITSDTLRILRQTLNASGRLLQGKTLPRLGAPLIDFSIKTLKQDPDNKDSVIVEMPIQMATVLNYLNLYLVV